MSTQTLTLQVPGPLYSVLKKRADESQRSVEAETLDLLAATMPVLDELSPSMQATLESLTLLETDALWSAARSKLANEMAAELQSLHRKQQRDGLNEAETQRRSELIEQYERAMLIRAQAAALLKERGNDLSGLFTRP